MRDRTWNQSLELYERNRPGTRIYFQTGTRLGIHLFDLYQIHFPFPPVAIETWMDARADAVQAGLTRAVGVSNYN